ncbi:cation transporter [Halorhodospira abdelmalekii]|nr:cation transporter [Halorhodospira abdelmalekii]
MRKAELWTKRRVTLVGGVVNLLLGLGKIGAGVIGQSQALIVDGVHSLTDLFSDGVVLLAATYGSQGADHDHPYGHARIETVATAFIGAVLLLVAGGFLYDLLQRLFISPADLLVPGWLALGVALLSILVKEGLYRYTRRAAERIGSNLLHANAWHHRSDALSSVVVVAGIVGVLLGFPWLDAVGAMIVALMLGYMGGQFVWQALRELVDTGLPPDEVEYLEHLITRIDGVHRVHGLRSRRMAQDAWVDVHILVDPRLSVSEGHRIAEAVREYLTRAVSDVAEVLVHVEHEDPSWEAVTTQLPLRRRVEHDLWRYWEGVALAERIERIDLHYMEGALEVEVHLPWEPGCYAGYADSAEGEGALAALAAAAERIDYVTHCRVHVVVC